MARSGSKNTQRKEKRRSTRQGGRAARLALRQAGMAEDQKPVHAGESSGRFKPLTDAQLHEVHEAALTALETVGLSQAVPSCVALVTAAGGTVTEQGRLRFPRSLIEHTLKICARDITLHAQDPACDLELSGERVYFGTAGAAVHVADDWHWQQGEVPRYRESTLQDVYDSARLVDHLEHVHFFQRTMVARDIESPRLLDLNTCYAAVRGTRKHIGVSFVSPENVRECLTLLHEVAGSEAAWRARPFMSASICFVVPPMRFAEDACGVLEACVEGGMPVLLLSAGQAGATSPAALAGSVVQAVAECLAGLAYVNLLKPGHPAIFGTWPFVADLRTGSMTGGSGEEAVLAAACGQMGRYYGLSNGIAAGMTDAKIPDAQAGYEKGYTLSMAAHCGSNLVYEAAGMFGSLLGFSHEGCVIDNELLGAINRSVRGVTIDTASLSLDTMREVCVEGPSHYLGHNDTLSRMERDYIYPELGDRLPPAAWQQLGGQPVETRAREKAQEILRTHFPDHIDTGLDQRLREQFDILLPLNQTGNT